MPLKPFCLFLLCAIFIGCESDPTTYQIVNNRAYTVAEKDSLIDGSMFEIVVFYYFENDIVGQNNIAAIDPAGGESDIYEVPEFCERVRISFTDAPYDSYYGRLADGARRFVARYDTLESKRNTRIIIDDETFTRYVYDIN